MRAMFFAEADCQGSPLSWSEDETMTSRMRSYVLPEVTNVRFVLGDNGVFDHTATTQEPWIQDTEEEFVSWNPSNQRAALAEATGWVVHSHTAHYWRALQTRCLRHENPGPLFYSWRAQDCPKLLEGVAPRVVSALRADENTDEHSADLQETTLLNDGDGSTPWYSWLLMAFVVLALLVVIVSYVLYSYSPLRPNLPSTTDSVRSAPVTAEDPEQPEHPA